MRIPILISLLILALIAYLVQLDSDPSPMKISSDLVDEAIWAHNARSKVLFGAEVTKPDYLTYASLTGPLYNLILEQFLKYFGANLFAIRLASVSSIWALCLFMILLLKKTSHSIYYTLLTTLILAINHQLFIFGRWGTPIALQLLFLAGAFYLPTLAYLSKSKTGRIVIMLSSGLSLAASVATKGTGINMLLAYAASVIFLWRSCRKLTLKDLLYSLIGFGIGFSGLLFVLYENKKYLKLLSIFILRFKPFFILNLKAADELGGLQGFLKTTFLNPGLVNPMTYTFCVAFLLLLFLRSLQIYRERIRHVDLKTLSPTDTLEAVSVIWVLGGLLGLILFFEFSLYRRYIPFIIPLSILFTKTLKKLQVIDLKKQDSRANLFAALILGISLWTYSSGALHYVDVVWLKPANLGFSTSMDNLKFGFAAFSGITAVGLFLSNRPTLLPAFLLCLNIVPNIGLSLYHIRNPTFSLRDQSLKLRQLSKRGDIATGYSPWTLATETELLPVYFNTAVKMKIADLTNFPEGIPSKTQDLFIFNLVDGYQTEEGFHDPFLRPDNLHEVQTTNLGMFKLLPFAQSERYRMTYQVFRVQRLKQ